MPEEAIRLTGRVAHWADRTAEEWGFVFTLITAGAQTAVITDTYCRLGLFISKMSYPSIFHENLQLF